MKSSLTVALHSAIVEVWLSVEQDASVHTARDRQADLWA